MRAVALLGSTGSIGEQALDVLRSHPDRFRVQSLAARANVDLLREQAREFRPRRVAVVDPAAARSIRADGFELLVGPDALAELAGDPEADTVLNAVPRGDGLAASVAALREGKRLALANKESMVLAGALLRRLAAEHGGAILPVDSEHSAIFQALHCGRREEVRRLYLTGSGGPFRTATRDEMAGATPERALKHPIWGMGRKITMDSATMMNKALEIVEARWLFEVDPGAIEVLIHPQAVVHSMVEFRDGAVIAQLGEPDMRGPIQYALSYPERLDGTARTVDFVSRGSLTFEAPDRSRFPSIEFGYRAAREGGTTGAVLNAANDVAAEAFLAGEIGFLDVFRVIGEVLDAARPGPADGLPEILAADKWARAAAAERLRRPA